MGVNSIGIFLKQIFSVRREELLFSHQEKKRRSGEGEKEFLQQAYPYGLFKKRYWAPKGKGFLGKEVFLRRGKLRKKVPRA